MSPGKLFIIGIGPGNLEYLTPKARHVIENAQVIIGYTTYLKMIEPLITEKEEVIYSSMRQERERCREAIELASKGKIVALISGGDPGIYGMAGLALEMASFFPVAQVPFIEIIPGVAALNACASRLGAPLMHDFASISLSDILTPWDIIEKRIEAASSADFVIVLYNPKSKRRKEQILKARDVILKYRPGNTPVGIVRHALRDAEGVTITQLSSMLDHEIDMQSTVIIGNSTTFIWENNMVTPRGYTHSSKDSSQDIP